jgi:flagellar biogenesis protein FliO
MEVAGVNILKFVFALIFVLGLIGAFAAFGRKMGFGNRGPMRRGGARRLQIVDTLALDPKRRMVIVRRDDVEHLVLLGSSSETVVETGIRHEPPQAGDDRPNLTLAASREGSLWGLRRGSKG